MEAAYITRLKESIDMREVAGRFTALYGKTEMQGPCPQCGGGDRFHCDKLGWFCRQCAPPKPAWRDVIEFFQWKNGLDFAAAVMMVENFAKASVTLPPPTVKRTTTPVEQDAAWREQAAARVARDMGHLRTFGCPGQEYLLGRGLTRETWDRFNLGFTENAVVPGQQRRVPAIVIPWYGQGEVRALRLRFIAPQFRRDATGKEYGKPSRQTALAGSQFGGRCFGTLGLVADYTRTLFVVEGEFNAMSIWQEGTHVNALSLGSESMKLTPAQVEYINRYSNVIFWADKESIARDWVQQAGTGRPVWSVLDANQKLQDGELVEWLEKVTPCT
jgi:hypothetical protein